MMKNFLFNVAGLSGSFTMKSREGECIDYIRKVVGKNKVLVCLYLYLYLSSLLILFLNEDVGQWWCRFDGLCRFIT